MFKVMWKYPNQKWIEGISRFYTRGDVEYQVRRFKQLYPKNMFRIVDIGEQPVVRDGRIK